MGKLAQTKQAVELEKTALREEIHQYGRFQLQLSAAKAATNGGERIIENFAELVYARHASPVRVQSLSYCDRLKASHREAYSLGKYSGGYCFSVGQDDHSLNGEDANSGEELWGTTI